MELRVVKNARDTAKPFWAGVFAEVPILVGVVPLGIAFGVGSMASGLGLAATQGLSSIVFAGSSQFVAAQMLSAGAPWALVVLTIFVVNLRHALYSVSVAPHTAHLSLGWKVVLSYLLTDEAYAVTILNYDRPSARRAGHWFFLGAGLTLWSGWQLGTLIGGLAGAAVPATWNLDFLLPLVFLGLLVPTVRDWPAAVTAIVAAAIAVLGSGLPYKLHFILAIFGGIAGGVATKRMRRSG